VRWNVVALIALKKWKRSTPASSAARSRRTLARPLSSSMQRRLVADRRRQVDDGRHPAQGLAQAVGVGQLAEVAERYLHVHPACSQAPRVADEAAHGLAPLHEQG